MRVFSLVKFWKLIGAAFIIAVSLAAFWFTQNYKKLPEGSVYQFNRQAEPYKIGPLKIGGEISGGPGDYTLAPYLKIPALQKFYVSVAGPDSWCINEDCGIDGAFIQTLGGWLQVEDTYQAEIQSEFGLDLPENKNVKSIVLIGDHNGKIVGIYPNKGLSDVIDILRLHPDLADFDLLHGVNEFGKLKVGDLSSLKPGDSIGQMSKELKRASLNFIPQNRKFYLYSLEKRKYDVVGQYLNEFRDNIYICSLFGGCRYSEPDPPHDFLFAAIEDLGGWFLANDNDNSKMIEMFGLNPQEVFSGKSSLVVLTDAKGIIVALHPNKRMSDALTILSQHPGLVDVLSLYR